MNDNIFSLVDVVKILSSLSEEKLQNYSAASLYDFQVFFNSCTPENFKLITELREKLLELIEMNNDNDCIDKNRCEIKGDK